VPEQASRTLSINTTAHFNTLSILLPYLTTSKTGAHVVTISSILAHLAPASLSDYTASKAAVSSLHHTLCNELRSHPDRSIFATVKTLLVEPGQLDTQLFADKTSVPFYAHFFGPVLEAKDVAKEILRKIERGDGGEIRMPFYAKCMPLFPVLPGTVQLAFRWFSGIDRAMKPVGRKV
jgi:short-subunit dehydrogenase